MDIEIRELMAQIGEQSVEIRALRQVNEGAVARIAFLEMVCAKHEIDLEAEMGFVATSGVETASSNGNEPVSNRQQRRSAERNKAK